MQAYSYIGVKMIIKTLLVLLCFCQLAWAAPTPLMPIKDLQAGMTGIGKTVIQGDKIEEFQVEILGVSGSETSGYSIFAKVSGDVIDRAGGVAQGMSGSPVYVDGRLVGAVAFGKLFNSPEYCFLMPIHNMLKLQDQADYSEELKLPKGTALQAGSFTKEALGCLQKQLEPYGLEVNGIGGSGGPMPTGALEPGSAIGVSLLQGDLTLGALGTVTWVDDQGHVLAFGHPFMSRGNSNFFMNKVWILGCIPNLQTSYKVGNLGKAIGTITQDRSSGIAGRVGSLPKYIPIYATALDEERQLQQSYRVEAIDDHKLLPAMVEAVFVNSITKAMDRSGGGTAKVHFLIRGADKEGKPLVIDRENMFYSAQSLQAGLDGELTTALTVLTQNKFEAVNIHNITVESSLSTEVKVAELTSVATKKRTVKAGEEIELKVTLRPHRGQEFDKIITFTVPKDRSKGPMALSVRGGSSMAWVQQLLQKQKEEGLPAQQKEQSLSLQDFVKEINEANKNNQLLVDITTPALGGHKEQELGFSAMLKGSPYKKKYDFDFIIDGEQEIVLQITD